MLEIDRKPTATDNILRDRHQPLDVFFSPRTVAVVGATEKAGSVGRTVLWNLISSPFGGTVYPVHPNRPAVLGLKAYPSLGALPEVPELAAVVTPAPMVEGIVRECASLGVRGAIVLSAGFRETGAEGAAMEARVVAEARKGRVRLIGPNCLGVMSPTSGFNATFAGAMAQRGSVGFLSQSGALCTAVLDWSLRELVGFSAFVSVGSMADVGWGDLIEYLGRDPETRSILIYMESVGDARSFLSAAREVALSKPIIIIKPGRSEAAAKAAASHTGALAGSDEVLDAAFRRSGILRVDRIADLFYMAEVLSKQPRPRGRRLAIVTNAGGPGVLATDALLAAGGELATLSSESIAALDILLPSSWSHANPIDVLGDAGPERYARAIEIVARDPGIDGLLAILTPQAMTDPTGTAERLRSLARPGKIPLLASWMGGSGVAAGEEILNRAGIPTFPYPDTAARAYGYMWRYSDALRALYETPVYDPEMDVAGMHPEAAKLIDAVRRSGRTLLTEHESKRLLAACHIPVVETRVARTADEAVETAEAIGYPVVVKLHSETITHKSDFDGVHLDLRAAAAVRRAFETVEHAVRERGREGDFRGVTVQPMIRQRGYELIVGSAVDAQFGPVLLFGSGGVLVEVLRDRALGLPPLNSTLARRIIERTRISKALRGVRGAKPVDLGALEAVLVRFAQLVVEQRWIREIEMNPLLASPEGIVALDARVVLYGPEVLQRDLPPLAIRPYPSEYASRWESGKGTSVMIRPIRPEDERMMIRFHESLSDQSVYLRYFHPMRLDQRIAHERLTRMCFIDYDREMALVAERPVAGSREHEILGVGRLIKLHGTPEAEFALLVSDQAQGHGLGTELLRRLVEIGGCEGVRRIIGDILIENQPMQRICRKLGFKLETIPAERLVKATLDPGHTR